ncbi:hypothetical protein [Bilophila wadsworthia]|uniref:hypothetical protein n=1 Tax=Bilophila wadsworthia TaxID=35833 RepID=UPI002676239F|nr:hypothetical protein [Bilophila wadsworthia]
MEWFDKAKAKVPQCGATWNWCTMKCERGEECFGIYSDFEDAAEFEARVAERVAIMAQNFQLIHAIGCAVPNVSWFLKQARIAVEQEMEEVCLKN